MQLAKNGLHRDYALSVDLAYASLTEDMWFLNPLNWFEKIYFYFTGYHAVDTVIENPDNRGAYISNVANKNAY